MAGHSPAIFVEPSFLTLPEISSRTSQMIGLRIIGRGKGPIFAASYSMTREQQVQSTPRGIQLMLRQKERRTFQPAACSEEERNC
jgi:hypothetical protein